MNYIEWFAAEAEKNGSLAALVDQGTARTTSYAQLDRLSSLVAGKLHALGCGEGDFVTICMDRSMEYVVAWLGSAKAGCAVVPLSIDYPQERVDYIVNDCGAKLTIRKDFFDDLERYEACFAPAGDDSPAYVIYTSGSTGYPKGVCHTVRGVYASAVRHINDIFRDSYDCRYLSMAQFSFGAVFLEIFARLLLRNTIYILPDEARQSPRLLTDYLRENKIDGAHISPQLLRLLDEKDLSVKRIDTGSEAIGKVYFPTIDLYYIYGQSETMLCATYFKLDRAYDHTPIGKAINGVTAHVLDEEGKEVPNGVTGELCVEGEYGVSYLNNPEKTAKTFAKLENGNTLIHTGDNVFRDDAGRLVYVSRRDWMVKINGQRVETMEVERKLNAVEGVAVSAVRAWTDNNQQNYIAGYYQTDGEITEEEIRQALKKSLPDYMIPRFLIRMEALPKNLNGKLDRRSLPEPELDRYKEAYVPASNENERQLCEGFSAVLHCGQVGINDSFIVLGGDSIKVMKLIEALPFENLTPPMILSGKTPAGIARLLEESQRGTELIPHMETIPELCPLTEAQQGVYLECLAEPNSLKYNIPAFIHLPGGTDEQRFINAVRQTVEMHPAFFITTEIADGIPSMRYQKQEVTIAVTEAESLEEMKTRFVRPFDLEKGPLYRFELCHCGGELYFLLDVHHIIFDGSSVEVFAAQIESAYEGRVIANEELTVFDLANAEKMLRESEAYRASQRFFAEKLGEIEPFSAPESDLLDTKKRSGASSISMTNLGFFETAELSAFIKEHGITENTLFMGAFAYVLAAFTGTSVCGFSTVNNGRHDPRLANSTGMFVKTLPLSVTLRSEMSVRDYLSDLQKTFFDTMGHDCISFGELVSAYGVNSDVLFVYQSEMLNAVETIDTGELMSKITAMVFKEGDGYRLNLSFLNSLYSEAFMASFGECVMTVVKALMKKETLGEIELLSEHQKRTLDVFNETQVPYDQNKTIVDLFREMAAQHPDNIAVVYTDKKYTYRETDALTDRIAVYLRSQGIGRGDVVSILIGRSEYMPIASLGVLKTGAAYQPLDTSYPEERLSFMVEDAAAKLLIADEAFMEKLPAWQGKILYTKDIPSLPEVSETEGKALSEAAPKPDDLFILLYTSGSTGVPKGVKLLHRNILTFCSCYRRFFGLDENSCAAAYASYGFDACMMDMYPTLTAGSRLLIVHESVRLDLIGLNELFREQKVTHSFMTTQVGRQFAQLCDSPYLKYLSVGGEALVPIMPPKGFELFNAYGPTESTVYITLHPVTELYRRTPIGKALDNTKLYVVDQNRHRLPVGVPGELCVAGPQVSAGYLNRPEKTAEVYKPNSFDSAEGYETLYCTGDIVRLLPDGTVDFVGRNDGQVKIRGFRIELTEVEEVIRRFPGIKDATVVAFDAPTGGKEIVAYVVSDEAIDTSALKAFIRSEKPAYMVPAVTMQIDSIPLNQNQKVNKKALPKPELAAAPEQEMKNGALTECEQLLLDILKDTAGITTTDVTSELIGLGVTSISAISFVTGIEKKLGVDYPVTKLLQGASIMDIENEIMHSFLFGKANSRVASEKQSAEAEILDEYPLTQTQLGVYYETMRHPESVLYNVPLCLKFEGIDAGRLCDALRGALRAHPYLNTHITTGKNGFMQVRNDSAEPEIAVSELGGRDIREIFRSFIRPFMLHEGPLYRLEVITGPGQVWLLMDFHHIVFDGFSVNLFMDSVKSAYETGVAEAEEYSYFDYSLDEEKLCQSDEYAKAEGYFRDLLSDFENTTEIPADKSGKAEDGKAASVSEYMDRDAVESFCKANRITPSTLFLASAFYTVSRFASSKNVYLSTISNGRANARTRGAIGMFVRTLPVAIRPKDGMSVADYISAAGESMTGSIAHEIYPFTEIAGQYGYTTDIMYECQLGVLSQITVGGHTAESLSEEEGTLKFKLKIVIADSEDGIRLSIGYNNALYSEKYMQLLARSLKICTEKMIAAPSAQICHLSLLTEEDEAKLEGFSKTEHGPVPAGGLVHRMFEERAAAHPDKTAIIACDGQMSYGELNKQANIIANNLISRGVRREDMIVLLLPRRSYYFAAVLGVLKTGAAFIPCDPQYPAERISLITEDSGAQYIVTTEDKFGQYESGKAINIADLLTGDQAEDPQIEMSPEDLAYAIYTSGSTGKPKGVLIRHIGVCNYFSDAKANILYSKASELNVETVLCITTVSFDMSMKDGLGILCNGKTLIFADEEQMNDPMAIAALMEKYNVELFSSTPSRIIQYLDYAPFAEQIQKQKIVICGAEMYPMSLLKTLQEMTKAELFNSYGPTEITISANMAHLTQADHISVGKPLYNYTEYIVDTDDNLLPPGVIGELYVGGPGVAKGYKNLDELTQKQFVEYRGLRVYKTGDYARWDEEGNVIILGRKDNQVKLRGLRIELGEIETLITQQPSVKQALVLIKKLNGQDTLCAYYTATEKLDATKLRDALKQKLTHYMVPTAYLQLDVFPVNANGKTDRKALPEPVPLRTGDYVEAADQIERFFCDVFAKALKLDQVGAEDDFFEYGGSSLTVTSIVVEAVEAGYQLSYSDVFSHTTPRALAAFVAGSASADRDSEIEDFDYSAINSVLRRNTVCAFRNGEQRELGNILLTGATGFMGTHVLYQFLRQETGKVYCLLRKGKFPSAQERLKSMMFYYFGKEVSEEFDERVKAYNGDVTDYESFRQFEQFEISTVFNCAANVKHFSAGTDIEDVNIGGADNCIAFCRKKNARLIHFSTVSTAGEFRVRGSADVPMFTEQTLYVGQVLDNKYTHSKFIAERNVLAAVAEGLDAKIIRVGTLAPRNRDGEFQINYLTNNFMGRLRTYALVGAFPYSMAQSVIRMGAIDLSATAFLKLAKTPRECCLFNACNNHTIYLADIIACMRERGKNIRFVEKDEFNAEMMKAAEDPAKAAIISSLLAYAHAVPDDTLKPVSTNCTYTNDILYRMDFMWDITDRQYVERFLTALEGLRFFDVSNLLR